MISTGSIGGVQEVSRLHPDDPHGHLQELRTDPDRPADPGARGVR